MHIEQPPNHRERRANPRVTPDEDVVVRFDWSQGGSTKLGTPIRASGIDLSLGGLQLSLEFSLPVGYALKLQIELPERRNIFKASGVVAWTGMVEGNSEYRVGVNLDDSSVDNISQWSSLFLPGENAITSNL